MDEVIGQVVPDEAPSDGRLTEGKPRVWTVYTVFCVFFSMYILYSIILTVIGMFVMFGKEIAANNIPSNVEIESRLMASPLFLILSGLGTIAISMFLVVVCTYFSKEDFKQRLSLKIPSMGKWWIWLLVTVGAVAFSSAVDDLFRLTGLSSTRIQALIDVFSQSSPLSFFILLVIVGLFAPISEELLFRGYIQSRLTRRHGTIAGIAIASIMFGIVHMDVLHSIYAFGLGVYLGFVAVKFGSIWPAVAGHLAVNTISCLCARYTGISTLPATYALIDLVVCSAIFTLALYIIIRNPAVRAQESMEPASS